MRISEVLHRDNTSKKSRAPGQVDRYLVRPSNDLTTVVKTLTKEGVAKHSRNLYWSRAFLSKSRYMAGRQCHKRLWQILYNGEPVEEPLPGSIRGIGIEVGIKARLLWPGGVRPRMSAAFPYSRAVRRSSGYHFGEARPTPRRMTNEVCITGCAEFKILHRLIHPSKRVVFEKDR